MMRVLSILPALVLFGAFAATVPQKSQYDYYFSIPNATNSVTRTNLIGEVIGQPPAYMTLRREDVAWLREAACERAALANGSWWTTNSPGRERRPVFGHFPLSHTNRFNRYTIAREWRNGQLETNIVVGWIWFTNAFNVVYPMSGQAVGKDKTKPTAYDGVDVFGGLSFGSGDARYLATTKGLLQGSRHYKNAWPPYHTNIVTTVVTNWGGFSFDENDNIVFHRSNHIEVVTMPMTNGTVSVHTNSWSVALPWSTTSVGTNVASWSYFDLLFDGGEARWDEAQKPSAMKPFARYSYVTNCYNFLSGKKWLVDQVSNTNKIEEDVYIYSWHGDTHYLETSYTTEATSVGIRREGWVLYQGGGFLSLEKSKSGRLIFPSRFKWDVVHTGGVCRIKEATLYALVSMTAYWRTGSSNTNVWGGYMTKIGTATKVNAPGGNVCFETSLNGTEIALSGAAAIGAPTRQTWTEWGDDEGSYNLLFFLVYELQPWASLPGWGNQQGEPSP